MKLLFCFCIATAMSLTAYSQQQQMPEDGQDTFSSIKKQEATLNSIVVERCTDFFKLILKDEIDLAFSQLFQGSALAGKDETKKGLVDAYLRSVKAYGEIKGFELVNYEIASASFLRIRYLALHRDYPIRWIFTFYKSPIKGWIVINVKFDDDSQYIFLSE